MEIIGEKLKASREENGLSQEEVAEDLKVTAKDIENLEKGDQKAFEDIFMLKKLIYDYAKYLGLDYEDLIEEFNEFMFEYTSRIPVAAIEKYSKVKVEEEEKIPALSPYTIRHKKDNRRLIIIIIVLLLAIATVITLITVNNNKTNNNNNTLAALI